MKPSDLQPSNTPITSDDTMRLKAVGIAETNGYAASSSKAAQSDLTVGQQLGRFVLLEFLGRGGFGCVYRALDPRLEREVAIKAPRPDLFDSEGAKQRFVREARAAAKIEHPNVCRIYE